MNLGITIARKGKTFTVLTTPEVALNVQRRKFRVLRRELIVDGEPKYDELQLWSSNGGRQKRAKLRADVAPLPIVEKPKKAAPPAPVPATPAASVPAAPKPPAPPPRKASAPKAPVKGGKKSK